MKINCSNRKWFDNRRMAQCLKRFGDCWVNENKIDVVKATHLCDKYENKRNL
jgi:hypothetical protein